MTTTSRERRLARLEAATAEDPEVAAALGTLRALYPELTPPEIESIRHVSADELQQFLDAEDVAVADGLRATGGTVDAWCAEVGRDPDSPRARKLRALGEGEKEGS